MITLKVGVQAPDFTLKNQNNDEVSLNQFLGHKVLVYFYPKAMTPGCTVLAQNLRDAKAELDKLGLNILGISPDKSQRLEKFSQRDQLNFTLLSDEDHRVANAYGVWGLKKFMGKEYDGIHRISFLIDETGKIEQVFTKFKTKEHHQVVLDYLQSDSNHTQ